MPSNAQRYRYATAYQPQRPSYGGGGGGGTLIDLIMQRGDQQAEAYRASGEIWGNAINQLGQGISSGITAHQEEKKLKARDAAWIGFVNEGQWANDPKLAYTKSVEIWGPQEGPKQFQALAGVSQLTNQKRDPAADQKALGSVGAAYLKLSPEGRALMYPQIRTLTVGAMPEFGQQMPEQYDPAFDEKVVSPFVQSMQPEPKREKVTERRPDGTEVTRFVDPAAGGEYLSAPLPKDPKKHMVTVPGPGGRPMQRLATEEELAGGVPLYREPKAAPRPQLERIETVGPDGKPVTQFVTPTAGATYAKPTGQAKAATGQQRRALNFFNRGKEALDIATPLEESIAEYGLANQGRLAYEGPGSNFIKNKEQQSYRQAQRAFTEARLRKDSGGAVKDEEYENDAVTYFAQPGDSKATIEQKRKSRLAVLAGIAHEAGDAMREFYGDEAPGLMDEVRGRSVLSPGQPVGAGISSSDDELLKKYGY